MLLETGNDATRRILSMENRLQVDTKEALSLPYPGFQLGMPPPWEMRMPVMSSSAPASKSLPERPEPLYPPVMSRELLALKTVGQSPSLQPGGDAGLIRHPFYPFPPLPTAGGMFPIPLHVQPFAAGQLLPKYLPFSPFLFHGKYPLGKKTFRCQQCRYVTDRKNNLKRHVATMHQDCGKTLECCDIVFKSKAALRDHVLLFHRTGYKCRYCGRNFCRKALLKRHLAVHNGQKDFICSICDYATSHKSNLERHKKVHGQCGDYSGDEGDYIPEPEEADIDVENDMDTEVGEEDSGQGEGSLGDPSGLFDPMLESTAFHTGKKAACHKGKFNLPDRLKQTHEERKGHEPECGKGSWQGSEPGSNPGTARSPTCNGQLERSPHLQEPSNKVKMAGHRRLFANPYKCSECTLSFAAQHQLALHVMCCKGEPGQVPVSLMATPASAPDGGCPSLAVAAASPEDRRSLAFSLGEGGRGLLSTSGEKTLPMTPADNRRPATTFQPSSEASSPSSSSSSSTSSRSSRPSSPASPSSGSSDETKPRNLPLKKRCVNTLN